jgi:hypothetical protein
MMSQIGLDYVADPASKSEELTDYIDRVAQQRMDKALGPIGDRIWAAFTIGVTLGMKGQGPQPGHEYVLEEEPSPGPDPA